MITKTASKRAIETVVNKNFDHMDKLSRKEKIMLTNPDRLLIRE